MSDFDPAAFGRMQAELESLRRDHDRRDAVIDKMAGQIEELLALANRHKGGLWMGMTAASVFGGVMTFIADYFLRKP